MLFNLQAMAELSLLPQLSAEPFSSIALQVYAEKVAVKGVSMSMKMGEITALLGHNGAGKSFCLSLL